MGMKKCKECGEEVSTSAKTCPKCGKDQRNFFKKHPVICIIGIIIVLGIALGSGSSNEPKNTLNNGTNTENNTNTVVKTEFIVGEVYEDDYIAIKYVSKNENFTKYNEYANVKKGYKVVQASFEFENVGSTDKWVSSVEFTCYADGYDCESFIWVDDASFSANLSSGKKTKGSVYFEVPKDAKEIYLEYETDFWDDEKIKFVIK